MGAWGIHVQWVDERVCVRSSQVVHVYEVCRWCCMVNRRENNTCTCANLSPNMLSVDVFNDHHCSLFAYCVESYHRARACSRLVVKNQERKDLLATLESFMVKYAINALQQKGE